MQSDARSARIIATGGAALGVALSASRLGSAFLAPSAGSAPGAPERTQAQLNAASLAQASPTQPANATAPSVFAASAAAGVALAAARASGRRNLPRASEVPVAAFENELGVQAPLGFWDPVGFSKDGAVYTFNRRRSVEIKHGRVCMLATMGYITPELVGRFPGVLSPGSGLKFTDIPNGLAAISKVPFTGWCQILAYGLFVEAKSGYDNDVNTGKPGNMGWRPPLLATDDPETKKRRLNAEIANGRLAMMAIIGMFFQDGLTGSAWGDWALYTDSPLRAFENELGVQAPVGYWDPLGLATDGDADAFYRRRCTEVKHGRVAMFAAMGYIFPEYVRFPGLCATGLKFADIPNGLSAIGKMPAAGIAQWFVFCGFLEVFGAKQDPSDPPGKLSGSEVGYGPSQYGRLGLFKAEGISDPAAKKRALNSELANGRLAMMAIIGMFFQDGCTGSAWGDWSLYTDSPLRAFESETGVTAPFGYWDPLGFSKDGDEMKFKRRRASELKHGRIAMYATMGYIVPEYFKFPGLISPSLSMAFSDVPNGLGALSKVPEAGGLQMFLFGGFIETVLFKQDVSRAPGDFENVGNLGVPNSEDVQDAEARKRGLNSELNNGRLAMMAIMGMFFQDGLTGAAWGDWSLYTDSPLR